MNQTRVGVVGYGTIGKRVVDAIRLQPDLKLTGVSKVRADFESSFITEHGIRLYAVTQEADAAMKSSGISTSGLLKDMLAESDVIIDCTPEGTGAKNKQLYQKVGIKAVFQGGEKPDIAQTSFVSEVNYADSLGKDFVRVVSCNTTGLCRTLSRINEEVGLKKVNAVIVRRAADPNEIKKGPINSLVPNPAKLPSHHAEDVRTILKGLDIFTSAVIAPTTLMHVHVVSAQLERASTKDNILSALSKSRRIRLVDSSMGIDSTASILEFAKDLKRPRNDMPEVVVWSDSVYVKDNEVHYMQAVHQESIVVPENIDAVRAMLKLETDPQKSIDITNQSLLG